MLCMPWAGSKTWTAEHAVVRPGWGCRGDQDQRFQIGTPEQTGMRRKGERGTK